MKKTALIFSTITIIIIVGLLIKGSILDGKPEVKEKYSTVSVLDRSIEEFDDQYEHDLKCLAYSDGCYDYYLRDEKVVMVLKKGGNTDYKTIEKDDQLSFVKSYVNSNYNVSLKDELWSVNSVNGGTEIVYKVSYNGDELRLVVFSFDEKGNFLSANIELSVLSQLDSGKEMLSEEQAIQKAKEYLTAELKINDDFSDYNITVVKDQHHGKIFLLVNMVSKGEVLSGYTCEIDAYTGELWSVDVVK